MRLPRPYHTGGMAGVRGWLPPEVTDVVTSMAALDGRVIAIRQGKLSSPLPAFHSINANYESPGECMDISQSSLAGPYWVCVRCEDRQEFG